MSSGENHAHERMETAATMVDYQDYFSKEPKVSPSSSKRQEEPALQVSDAIPPNHVSRTLVVCFDGTGNK
jgi:hypothetical protein